MKFYFFTSSRKSDKCRLTIATHSERRAFAMALVYFKTNGLKGTPKRLAV